MRKFIREFIDNEEFKLTLLKDRINVVNYSELLQINNKEMILKSTDSKIFIHGNNLVLSKLLDDEILITGEINSIEVHDEQV